MKSNKNLKNTFTETVKPTSQQLKELAQSLSNANAAQKLKQTQPALTNAMPTIPTTSVYKASSIGSDNTLLGEMQSGVGTNRTYEANTSGFDNIVETWEKEKAAQERINRQQTQSFNAIGSTNKQTNNNSGGLLQGLSALNQALRTYSRSTSVKEPITMSRTTSTALNTVSSVDPAAATTKSSGTTSAKPADDLYYDAGDGSYTHVVNGNPYKVTYKDARYGAIRNEYNKTHTPNITYDMDNKGVITKTVNDTPYRVKPSDSRYARVANEFLATNIGDKTDQGIRDLAKKYPALQVNWWDNGGDDTITIGLNNTREPLLTLTDEYEDGTYTSPNGIITCKLQKGGKYVIVPRGHARANSSGNNQAVTTEQTNTSLDRYTNRPQMASRDGSQNNNIRSTPTPVTVTLPNGQTKQASIIKGVTTMPDDSRPPQGAIVKTNNKYYLMQENSGVELFTYIGGQTNRSLATIVNQLIPTGSVNWNGAGKPITIKMGNTIIATLTYNPDTGLYSTKNNEITSRINPVLHKLIITKSSDNSSASNTSSGSSMKNTSGKMDISDGGLAFIAAYESFSPIPYTGADTQNQTIGFGHVIKPGESFDHLTYEQALELLKKDIAGFVAALNKLLEGVNLSQQEFDALVSFVYNVGVGNSTVGFKSSTLYKNLINGKPITKENFTVWDNCNGSPLLGLWRRRMDEWQVFSDGTYNRDYPNW